MSGFIKHVRDDGTIEFRHPNYDDLTSVVATPPDEILTIATEEVARYEATLYQRQRATSYPSIQDQLDLLYHGGYDAWKAQIQAVKDKYPKPILE